MKVKLVRVWVIGDVVREVVREDDREGGDIVLVKVRIDVEDGERVLELLVLLEDVLEVVDDVDMIVEEFVEIDVEDDEES
ncbi:hypothetical protein M407DRAFT_243276 [Tulasnella calospora MUT 4182]|uniref:Uncharacterized protein n=1 Tax=Tulasnella calospora MUT 4182 TaxID=1051891 RepID=A0A0C3M1V1_9AGAM|nr:hypothetical protein M407DRAFT_243276 [Tulasnella calospora MUT 4182]